MFSSEQALFLCIILQVAQKLDLVNEGETVSFHLVGIFHALYNLQLSDKYEKLLKEVRWNDAYLILGLEHQYVGNYHNNATHISSVVMHVGMVDMHTF